MFTDEDLFDIESNEPLIKILRYFSNEICFTPEILHF